MDIISLNAQIQETRRKREALKKQKKENEQKIKSGEDILLRMNEYRKKSVNAISDFQDKLDSRCNNMPGNFGKYYKRQIDGALKKSNAYEADNMTAELCKAIKESILDLDEIIETIKSKIEFLNDLLKRLGDLLEDAKDAVEDVFVGGKN